MPYALSAVLGYALGCLPFAVIVSRAMGLADPRGYGSGNPGATNVLRSGNRVAALLTLLGDAIKGVVAIGLTYLLAARLAWPPQQAVVAASVAGFAAFVGHLFPITLGFRGGKGVATAAGVLLAIDWRIGLCALAVWLAVAIATRYSSLAAMVAALAGAVAGWWLLGSVVRETLLMLMALLVVWRHGDNIRRLMAGTETRIGAKKTA